MSTSFSAAGLDTRRALTDSEDAGRPRDGLPDDEFTVALAEQAMSWHQQDMTEADVLAAITATAVTLMASQGGGAAVLIVTAGGGAMVRAEYGILPNWISTPPDEPEMMWPSFAAAGWLSHTHGPPAPGHWPVFASPELSGEASMVCARLGFGTTSFGTLILTPVHHTIGALTAADRCVLLAMQASVALAAARYRTGLRVALASRDVIGQAKGMLMERHHMTAADAFTHLVRLSENSNIKLRDLCSQLVDTGEMPGHRVLVRAVF